MTLLKELPGELTPPPRLPIRLGGRPDGGWTNGDGLDEVMVVARTMCGTEPLAPAEVAVGR